MDALGFEIAPDCIATGLGSFGVECSFKPGETVADEPPPTSTVMHHVLLNLPDDRACLRAWSSRAVDQMQIRVGRVPGSS
jgi:hypothetical protein